MIRRGKKTFERRCPVSRGYCESLSVKLMVWGVCVGGGGDYSVAVVQQDADVVTGHAGKEAVVSCVCVYLCVFLLLPPFSFVMLPLDPPHFSMNMSIIYCCSFQDSHEQCDSFTSYK